MNILYGIGLPDGDEWFYESEDIPPNGCRFCVTTGFLMIEDFDSFSDWLRVKTVFGCPISRIRKDNVYLRKNNVVCYYYIRDEKKLFFGKTAGSDELVLIQDSGSIYRTVKI